MMNAVNNKQEDEDDLDQTEFQRERTRFARGGRDYDQLRQEMQLTQSIFRTFDEKGDTYDKLGYHSGWPSGFPEDWFLEFRCYNNSDIAGEILSVATAADEERKARLKKAEERRKANTAKSAHASTS
jgi:hypothetical protein